jgi:hypothetical protein
VSARTARCNVVSDCACVHSYVACQQALVFSDEGADLVTEDDFWRVLMQLGTDPIVNVRIGVARLVGIICGESTGWPAVCGARC